MMPPRSPVIQIRSLIWAPSLLTICFLSTVPVAVTLIVNPVKELDVSPPARSISYFLQARFIPTYIFSMSSTENLELIPIPIRSCEGFPVHSINIRYSPYNSLIAKVFKWCIDQVKMNSFE